MKTLSQEKRNRYQYIYIYIYSHNKSSPVKGSCKKQQQQRIARGCLHCAIGVLQIHFIRLLQYCINYLYKNKCFLCGYFISCNQYFPELTQILFYLLKLIVHFHTATSVVSFIYSVIGTASFHHTAYHSYAWKGTFLSLKTTFCSSLKKCTVYERPFRLKAVTRCKLIISVDNFVKYLLKTISFWIFVFLLFEMKCI